MNSRGLYVSSRIFITLQPMAHCTCCTRLFHRSSNIHVVASIFADNQVGVDIDRADNIVLRDTTFIGQSPTYQEIFERQNLGRGVCSEPHIGLEIHTHRDQSTSGLQVEDCRFVGYAHLPCDDAVPLRLDETVRNESVMHQVTALAHSPPDNHRYIRYVYVVSKRCL